jgi:hypothetical protein
MLLPLEAVAGLTVCERLIILVGPDGKPKPEPTTTARDSHIVDITEEYISKGSLIFTGQKKAV